MRRPTSTRRSRTLIRTGAGFCLAASMTAYAASPLVALWSAAGALQRQDAASLRADLDWSQVRNGLKDDFGADLPLAVTNASATTALVQDELPGFGESFATTVVSHVVDDMVTPENLISMLSHADAGSGPTGTGPTGIRAALSRIDHLGFHGPARFDAAIRTGSDPAAAPVLVSMRIEKWQWKIVRIHLPAGVAGPGPSHDRT